MDARSHIAEAIKSKARELGFDAVGVARADSIPDAKARLTTFLELGRHGDMAWMETRAGERADPQALWPAARSVVALGLNYGPEADPLLTLTRRECGSISVYAQNRDYHDVVKKKLKALGRFIADAFDCEVKVFVDTAPVMEKPLAEAAGVGWRGKHTNLVSTSFGSWLFLGMIYTSLDLAGDARGADRCGVCRRCLDACPTNAFPAPYQLDARRCISYLTIEHKAQIPLEFREAVGNRIYGCDDCLAVCPWNKFASASRELQLKAREDLVAPDLEALSRLDDAAFRKLFAGSPVKRIGRNRFVRNVLIAIGNSKSPRLAGRAAALVKDPAPVVRGAAIWAARQLMNEADFAALKKANAGSEVDPGVRSEWETAS
jgi:epoxyqueuosine reductase